MLQRWFFIFVLTIVFFSVHDIKGACMLNMNRDFGTPSPVFLRDGKFLAPNTNNGSIALRKSERLVIACPGHKIIAKNITSFDVLDAHCVQGNSFLINKKVINLKDIVCSSQPWYMTEMTQETCRGNLRIYKVGYKINNKFHPLYKACFDNNLLSTSFVVHELSPNSIYMQNVRRPQFTEGDLFKKVKMANIYKTKSQKARLDNTLGDGMADKYLSKNQFLTRGHLAARADFITSAETRATFHYINTVPQWMRGNAGDWAALEEGLRRRVHKMGTTVTVYTGGHGVMTLPDSWQRSQPIYLHADENNNGIVPVPLYMYKLVYNAQNKTAAAFITINSSFYNKTAIDDLEFCENICNGETGLYSWLTWKSNDGTHSFCCRYDSFVNEVDYLPKMDVTGLFD